MVVERKVGGGNLVKINFVIDDGENSESFEIESNLQELEKFEFTLVPEVLMDMDLIKNIKIYPVYESGSGGETIGGVSDNFNTENLDVGEGEFDSDNYFCAEESCEFDIDDVVLWWNFDGDAIDEIAELTGVVEGATLTTGHFDQAYNFDGNGDLITVSSDEIFNGLSLPATMSFWIKPNDVNTNQKLFYRQDWLEVKLDNGDLEFKWKNDNDDDLKPKIQELGDYEGEWIHVVSTISATDSKIYLNGIYKDDDEDSFEFRQPENSDLIIGTKTEGNYEYDGVIDEIMFFDRELSDSEVLTLFELSVS